MTAKNLRENCESCKNTAVDLLNCMKQTYFNKNSAVKYYSHVTYMYMYKTPAYLPIMPNTVK